MQGPAGSARGRAASVELGSGADITYTVDRLSCHSRASRFPPLCSSLGSALDCSLSRRDHGRRRSRTHWMLPPRRQADETFTCGARSDVHRCGARWVAQTRGPTRLDVIARCIRGRRRSEQSRGHHGRIAQFGRGGNELASQIEANSSLFLFWAFDSASTGTQVPSNVNIVRGKTLTGATIETILSEYKGGVANQFPHAHVLSSSILPVGATAPPASSSHSTTILRPRP